MANTSDLGPGVVIKYNNELCVILESQHRTPGNLRAFYQVKMRNMKNGKLLENRFRSGEEVELIRIDKKQMQYLYKDGDDMVFMDTETYEQVNIPKVTVGVQAGFLKESGEASRKSSSARSVASHCSRTGHRLQLGVLQPRPWCCSSRASRHFHETWRPRLPCDPTTSR